MFKTILAILDSKKFVVAIIMALCIFLGQFFVALSSSGDVIFALAAVQWLEVAAPIMTAIGAQGLADFGKEKVKVENGS